MARTTTTSDLYRQRAWLAELDGMGRAERRRRGIKASRADIQQELGRVTYLIERIENGTLTPPGTGASNG
jgi:hypothetical protein